MALYTLGVSWGRRGQDKEPSAELASLLGELDIQIAPVHAYRRPRTTMATACLKLMLAEYGYAHAKLVLMSIVETKGNARELTASVLWAISDLVRAHPKWAAQPSLWLEAFDQVHLGELRAFAKRNHGAVKVRSGLATILFGFLHTKMEPQQQSKRSQPERLAA